MQGHCNTYTYTGSKCILIQNKPDGLKFLASDLIPIFKKGKHKIFLETVFIKKYQNTTLCIVVEIFYSCPFVI